MIAARTASAHYSLATMTAVSRTPRTPPPRPARVLVVMGVAGAGKSTVGALVAESLGWAFADADAFHAPASVARMARGEALGDADRWPWLAALRARIEAALAADAGLVLACSALRRAYRDVLVPPDAPPGALRFVYLRVGRDALARRLAARAGHYATAALLDSQLATLEEPAGDEGVPWVDGERSVEEVVAEVVRVVRVVG